MPAITPAQRTFIVHPSANGYRMFDYPDGNYVDAPLPDYEQTWSALAVSASYTVIDAVANLNLTKKTPDQEADCYTIINSVYRGSEGKCIRLQNNGGITDTDGRHRVEVSYEVDAQANENNYIQFDTEYWIGFSILVEAAADWPSGNSGRVTIISQMNSGGAGSAWNIALLNRVNSGSTTTALQFTRSYGTNAVELKETYFYDKGGVVNTTTTTRDFGFGRWYDIILNFIYDPDGTSGKFHAWVVDTSDATTTKVAEQNNIQLGFSDLTAVPTNYGKIKNSLYWGTQDRTGSYYKARFAQFRRYQGANGYSIVAPRGTPSP